MAHAEPASTAHNGVLSAEATGGGITVELVLGVAPRRVMRLSLVLSEGAQVAQALIASAWLGTHLPMNIEDLRHSATWTLGVWGRIATLDQVLRQGDRVEIYRGLTVDPKEARRVRYKAHLQKYPPPQKTRQKT